MSLDNPAKEIRDFPVSVYDDFRSEILLPCSGDFSCRIQWESAGKNTVSCEIRVDPMAGIIDLGIVVATSFLLVYVHQRFISTLHNLGLR